DVEGDGDRRPLDQLTRCALAEAVLGDLRVGAYWLVPAADDRDEPALGGQVPRHRTGHLQELVPVVRVVEQVGGNNQVELLTQVEVANVLDMVADAQRLGRLLPEGQFDHLGRQIHTDHGAGSPGLEQSRVEALAAGQIEGRLAL